MLKTKSCLSLHRCDGKWGVWPGPSENCMGADPLQGYRVPAQWKEARSKCGFELEDPGTVSVHLQNCHDQSWGGRESCKANVSRENPFLQLGELRAPEMAWKGYGCAAVRNGGMERKDGAF